MIILLYTRESSIYQTQLDDFLGNPKKIVFHMNVNKEYHAGWKELYPRHAPKKRGRPSRHVLGHLETLDYWFGTALVTRTTPMYLRRCKSPKVLTQDEVNSAFVSSWEYIALHAFPNFTGYVDYLFMDERFTFFDDVQFLLETSGMRVGARSLKRLIMLEFMRINAGIDDYTSFQAIFRLVSLQALPSAFSDLDFMPTVQDFSRAFHAVPISCFTTFHRQLVDDLMDLGLINFNIIIWDGQFIRANCSNQIDKTTGKYKFHMDSGLFPYGILISSFVIVIVSSYFTKQKMLSKDNHQIFANVYYTH